MPDMTFQHHLPGFVKSGFGGVGLCRDILTGNVFIRYTADSLNLADDFFSRRCRSSSSIYYQRGTEQKREQIRE